MLFTILLGVVENFKDLVEYLTLVISEGGELSDEAYMEHLRICKKFEEHINQDSDDKEDMGIEKIMELNIIHTFYDMYSSVKKYCD